MDEIEALREMVAAAEAARAAAEAARAASEEREPELLARISQLQLGSIAGAGAAGAAGEPGARAPLPLARVIVQSLMSKEGTRRAASGFALSESGIDEPVGWSLAAAVFLPEGRIFSEVAVAATEASEATIADFRSFRNDLNIDVCLPLSRSLVKVAETVVQALWDEHVRRWWPDVSSAGFSSTNERPENFPVPLVLGTACKVDFMRMVVLGEGVRRAVAVTAVAELKNTFYSPLNGVPQALVAAYSAAVDLRAKGLPAAECVVPFVSSTGALEQHGAAYLLEPNFPCAVLTTPVLDLADADGLRRAVAARWAFRRIADRTTALLLRLRDAPAAASAGAAAATAPTGPVAMELDALCYHIKTPLHLVGRDTEPSVMHQLRVFDRLRHSPAADDIVLPAAVLMQDPSLAVKQAAADSEAAGGAGAGAVSAGASLAPRAPPAWQKQMAMAFPKLVGYSDGVPAPGDPLRPAVLAALRAALRRVHRAGIVHLDLFPGNIMWARLGESEGGGASVSLRIIDFDAALEVGQQVPPAASTIIDRNGHTGSYHPGLFEDGARARVDFDWWHFCLLEDDNCPFARDHAALPVWLGKAGVRARLLARVAEEVASESGAEDAAGAAAPLQVTAAPPSPSA
jgi:hypothetical protein